MCMYIKLVGRDDDDDDQLYLNTLIFSTIYSWFPKEVC